MSVKIQKQIQFLCLICISLWAVLVITPPPNKNSNLPPSLGYDGKGPSRKPREATIEETPREEARSSLEGVKTWLKSVFHRQNAFPIKYHRVVETTEQGNGLFGAEGEEQHTTVGNYVNLINAEKPTGILQRTRSVTGPGNHRYNDENRARNAALRLRHYLKHPTTTCNRLVRVGGRSCVGAYDGSKLVCMDNDVKPRPMNCLVYSFGVGNDFSFDFKMQDYGCEVHSFDHDEDHEIHDYRQGPTAFFHKARIGVMSGFFKTCEMTQYGLDCQPALRYNTMAEIRRNLGHESRHLDYFKMDIEGAEWRVLEDVIQNSTIFTNTKQIALEIHMDELRYVETLEGKRIALNKYLDVFLRLKQLGFLIAAYEENEMNPRYEEVDGINMSIYAEVLLLKKEKNT